MAQFWLKTWRLDLMVAASLLTRIPIKVPENAYERQSEAVWAYGLIGVLWAAAVWPGCMAGLWLGLPPMGAALIGLALGIILTGAMHEDGLADSADGLWGGHDPTRRLEIMKDSAIGTYGVLALVISFALRWGLLVGLLEAEFALGGLIIAAMTARALMAVVMANLPHARHDGLSHSVGRPDFQPAYAGLALAVVIGLVLGGFSGVLACAIAGLTAWACARIASAKIGGQTGDILGATGQLSELVALMVLLACA